MVLRLTIFKDIQDVSHNWTAFVIMIIISIQWGWQVSREMYFVIEFGENASESFTTITLITLFLKYYPNLAAGEIVVKFLFFSDCMMMEYDIPDKFQSLGPIDLHILRALLSYTLELLSNRAVHPIWYNPPLEMNKWATDSLNLFHILDIHRYSLIDVELLCPKPYKTDNKHLTTLAFLL